MSPPETSRDVATTYPLPPTRILSISHPCITTLSPALRSLGGEQQLKHALSHSIGDSTDPDVAKGVEPVVGLSLHPDDPLAQRTSSTAVATRDVLVRVRLPIRTGRKRKRGEGGQWEGATGGLGGEVKRDGLTARALVRRMRDCEGLVEVEVLGTITDTHRFKTLPDFQVQADEVPIMREIRDHLVQPDYEKLKAFKADVKPRRGERATFPGPPNFATTKGARVYRTRRPSPLAAQPQSPNPIDRSPTPPVTPLFHSGTPSPPPSRLLGDIHAPPPKLRDILLDPHLTPIPTQPPATLAAPPPTSLVATIVTSLRTLLSTRPVIPRRVYWSRLQPHADKYIRRALPHVAYYLDTTPWRYSVVAFGVDPRSDRKYAPYQTVSFSRAICAVIKGGSAFGKPGMHERVFDGSKCVDPTEVWAACDLTEPLIARLVNISNLRVTYDDVWGWYFNGTLAKILVITKEKMMALSSPARKDNLSDEEYEALAGLPDEIKRDGQCKLDPGKWRKRVRDMAIAMEDEALRPTFGGIRGYEEVLTTPRKNFGLVRLKVGAVNGAGGGDENEGTDTQDGDSVGESAKNVDRQGEDVEEGAEEDSKYQAREDGDEIYEKDAWDEEVDE